MLRNIETIKDGITYRSMEASKTEERQPNNFRPILLSIDLKKDRGRLDCTRPCTIVAFRVLLQNNIV